MSLTDDIGDTAGAVWRYLAAHGPTTLYALERAIEAPKTTIAMALGWLAREGKLAAGTEGRTVRYGVKE